jgi:hypothetical protein
MAMRVSDSVEPIKNPPGTVRDGSRPKPPKAVALRASLEARRSVLDHKKAKRRLTDKTVAFPPAAQRCALEVVLSMLCDPVDAGSTSTVSIVCQMPAFDHRLNRL